VKVGDTVIFVDCSVAAEEVQLFIFNAQNTNPPPESSFFIFDERREERVGFNEPGDFTCLLQAINQNAPIQETRLTVHVKPQ